ncbi:MAG: hypothetical protein AAF541_23760 [Pseudomonadota bacterium]
MISSSAIAATQGELGKASQGSVEISLTIQPTVRISALQDISLSSEQGMPTSGSSPICLFASRAGEYTIKATGSGPEKSFNLSPTMSSNQNSDSRDTNVVPFEVELLGTQSQLVLQSGTPAALGNQISRSLDCENPNTLNIEVPQQNSPPGIYTGTLTLVISPN